MNPRAPVLAIVDADTAIEGLDPVTQPVEAIFRECCAMAISNVSTPSVSCARTVAGTRLTRPTGPRRGPVDGRGYPAGIRHPP